MAGSLFTHYTLPGPEARHVFVRAHQAAGNDVCFICLFYTPRAHDLL
jgi:hypothetical protein